MTAAHAWDIRELGPNELPLPHKYHLDMTHTSFGKLYTCRECGLVVLGSSDNSPVDEPGMPPCRPCGYRTGYQELIEHSMTAALTVGAAVKELREPPSRETLVAISLLCRHAGSKLLDVGVEMLSPISEWSPMKPAFLAAIVYAVALDAWELTGSADYNWHDGECCDDGCEPGDDAYHPDAMADSLHELASHLRKLALADEVMSA